MRLLRRVFCYPGPLGKLGLDFVRRGANVCEMAGRGLNNCGHKGRSLFAPVLEIPARAPSLTRRTLNRRLLPYQGKRGRACTSIPCARRKYQLCRSFQQQLATYEGGVGRRAPCPARNGPLKRPLKNRVAGDLWSRYRVEGRTSQRIDNPDRWLLIVRTWERCSSRIGRKLVWL
jgi:hypothetical protein